MKSTFLSFVTLFSMLCGGAYAQDPRVLEARVSDLERRVRALEEKFGMSSAATVGETKPVDTRQALIDNRDEIMKEIQKWAGFAYKHRTLPANRGGGGGSYLGFVIPREVASTVEGTISAVVEADLVTLTMESSKGFGAVSVKIGPDGRFVPGTLTFTGEFAKPIE
ncbi:MAG TPA: hypothetical protein VNN76_01875 [Bacteroidota bacterium]|nr:hypothetical protein [Bacteroidota bacterium]